MALPKSINERAFSYYRRLRRVKEYVVSRVSEPVSLKLAAEIAGLEKTYFSKFFHMKTGMRFSEWMNHIRVQHAMTLMRDSNMSITRVAHEAGFPTLRTFERAFNRITGMSPREFKKIVRPS
jgi:AraC-like DNA-binding protein